MHSNQEKVSIISEVLPYLRQFSGKTIVIKYGGASMSDPHLRNTVMADIALLHYSGIKIVLVHGGGPSINEYLRKLNINSLFRDGIRITDEQTMEIVEMVLTGKIQKDLINLLNSHGAPAVGLTGKDGNLFEAIPYIRDGQDWGHTGELININPELINILLSKNYLPVLSSIAPHNNNQASLNINADNVAFKVAIALKAEKLIYLTNINGVMTDVNNQDSLVRKINRDIAKDLIDKEIIQGGMIPKINNALDALDQGVNSVHILNGMHNHSLLLEIFTKEGIGTMLY